MRMNALTNTDENGTKVISEVEVQCANTKHSAQGLYKSLNTKDRTLDLGGMQEESSENDRPDKHR